MEQGRSMRGARGASERHQSRKGRVPGARAAAPLQPTRPPRVAPWKSWVLGSSWAQTMATLLQTLRHHKDGEILRTTFASKRDSLDIMDPFLEKYS